MAKVGFHFEVGPTQKEDKPIVHLFLRVILILASSRRPEAELSHLTVGTGTGRGGSGPREGPDVKPSLVWSREDRGGREE